jgi:hypothetical protein
MSNEDSSAQQPRENENEQTSASAPSSSPPADVDSGSRVLRTTPRTMSSISIHSFHSTTEVIQNGNVISVHSTHSSVSLGAPVDADILSIQTSIEQVASASQRSPNSSGVGARASFNSISDALGNLRSRLHQAHNQQHDRSTNRSSNRSSWIRRLQNRLHALDAAHSSRVPLRVMESRRRSTGAIDTAADECKNSEERRSTVTSSTSLHLSATIFHIDTRGAAILSDTAGDQTGNVAVENLSPMNSAAGETMNNSAPDDIRISDGQLPPMVVVRSSILFASRIRANRSIMEGTSNLLLASGGDGVNFSRRSLLGDRVLSSVRSSRDLEMHVHPSVRTFQSPIADVNVGPNQPKKSIDEDDDIMKLEPRDAKRLFQLGSTNEQTGSNDEIGSTARNDSKTALLTQEEDAMEVELTPGIVDDRNTTLYSWGRGDQSLHDDSMERIPLIDDDECKTAEMIKVSSRLQSKSILAISTGQNHSACATSQGNLYIAGKNIHGCVDPNSPEGTIISRPVLLDCISHVRVMQVSCGLDHTAVLSSTGSVVSMCFLFIFEQRCICALLMPYMIRTH